MSSEIRKADQDVPAAFLQDLIHLELKRGCQNDAAVGGFSRLVLSSLADAGSRMHKAGKNVVAGQIQSLFADYEFCSPADRRDRCSAALKLLDTPDGAKAASAGESRSIPDKLRASGNAVAADQPDSLFQAIERPVTSLWGVGPRLQQTFARLGIVSVADLLQYAPKRYLDLRQLTPLTRDALGRPVFLRARLRTVVEIHRKALLTKAVAQDIDGRMIRVLWFNNRFIRERLQPGHTYDFYGRLENSFEGLQLVQPVFEETGTPAAQLHMNRIVPLYHLTSGMTQKSLRMHMWHAVSTCSTRPMEYLPSDVVERFRLPDLAWSYRSLHFPADENEAEKARGRFAFDSLFLFELRVLMHQRAEQTVEGPHFDLPVKTVQRYAKALPFTATGSQLSAMRDIEKDLRGPQRMHRLLHGDVGSGKTAVAGYAVYAAATAGFQSAVLSPTEILAEQTGRVLQDLLAPFHVQVAVLTGGTPRSERKKILAALAVGDIHCLVGTHAILEEGVAFERFGLAIIDEQHRFGVVQRTALGQKGILPHSLVMSATPIPRTLALTIYGDLEISELTEKPAGRQPVRTILAKSGERDRAYATVRQEVAKGRQAFVVVPAIDTASENAEEETASVEKTYQELSEGSLKGLRVAFLHGRLKSKDKEATMKNFRDGSIDVLVATTVIEVGVDIPNATIMVIENAERFGLATLHQLRGRVGRGSSASLCILIQGSEQADSSARLKVLVESDDGFHIAEEDLKQRGPGDIMGTVQHGYDVPGFGSTALLRYQDLSILPEIRSTAIALVHDDPALERADHEGILRMLNLRYPPERLGAEEN